ncbi:MAG: ATP synthase F1 subunit delta [Nitrospirota bacterium]
MNKNQIAKKYSRALISSVDISEMPAVIDEFKAFSQLLDSKRQLKLLFAGKIFSEAEKAKAFEAISPSMKLKPKTDKFLKQIIIEGHLIAMKEIIAASVEAYNEKQKKATAVVVSSVALDAGYTSRLKTALKQMTGREITVENRIDESLLGGFIVKVGSKIFDSSLKGQLRLLKTELMR